MMYTENQKRFTGIFVFLEVFDNILTSGIMSV